MLTHIETTYESYYEDENRKRQGLYIMRDFNGNILAQGFYKDGKKHGEWQFTSKGITISILYVNGWLENNDANNISNEDRLHLSLKHDLRWLE